MDKVNYVIKHPHFFAYIMYCLSFIGYGACITSLGPLIPYIAESENRHETYFSFLFVCRSFGVIFGAVLSKFFQKYLHFHHILGFATLSLGISLIWFSYADTDFTRGISIFISCIFCAQVNIFEHICIIETFKRDNLDAWLQINHGAFGVGGLLGPYIVYVFEERSFVVIGIICLATTLPYFKLRSPGQSEEKLLQEQEKPSEQQLISFKNVLITCVMFYFIVGQQSTIGGWISSYAVLCGFSGKQYSTRYSSFYWISITFFRFALPFVPGKTSAKMKFLCFFAIFTTIFSLLLIHYYDPVFGIIVSTIFYGLSNSILFALSYTISQEFNLKLSPSQSSDFMISAALGQGTLVSFVGYLINLTFNDILYISVGLFNSLLLVLAFYLIKNLKIQQQEVQTKKQIQTEMKIIN